MTDVAPAVQGLGSLTSTGPSIAVGICAMGWAVGEPALAEWSAIATQQISYTSDAFQFSSARRLALSEDPSIPTVVPLGKPEDVIWEPSIEVRRSGTTGLGRNELSVKAHGFIYTDKPIFNHGEFRIQIANGGRDTSHSVAISVCAGSVSGPKF